jgi:glycine oxidase
LTKNHNNFVKVAAKFTFKPGVKMPHVAIVGAGLVGRLVAWRLQRSGWQVSLLDALALDDVSSASHVAAAMLSPLAELTVGDEVVQALAQRSMQLWPQWLAQLQTQTEQPIYARFEGTVVVAHPVDAAQLTQFQTLLERRLAPSQHSQIHTLNRVALANLEPALADRFNQGLLLAGEGQLANDQLLRALQLALVNAAIQWRSHCTVHELQAHQINSTQGIFKADVVIDTRGLGAKQDLPHLRGVRGEIMTVQCSGINLTRPVRLMHPRYQLYIAPRPDHRFVVGATELESQNTSPITVRSVLELGSALYSLNPVFGEAHVLHMAAALRPAFDNHQPTLSKTQGVWRINGLYRHGYLCAPALVDDLVQRLGAHPLA